MMFSNLTCEEQYRMYGAVHGDQAIELLDAMAAVEAMDGMEGTIQEAIGCYPGEDVLSKQITALDKLHKNVRGENKHALEGILEELIDLRRELYDNAEHGRDELRNVLKALEGDNE